MQVRLAVGRRALLSSAMVPLRAFVLALALKGAGAWSSLPGSVDAACVAIQDGDVLPLGTGRCVDAAGNTPSAYACLVPDVCPQGPLGDAQACAIVCGSDRTCTGFEIRVPDNATQGTVPTCFVFTKIVPTVGGWPWLLANGTQVANNGSGLTVVRANAVQESCCYKRPYPQSSPLDNPVPTPPSQTARQLQILANRSALAQAASDAALPILSDLIDFCADQFT